MEVLVSVDERSPVVYAAEQASCGMAKCNVAILSHPPLSSNDVVTRRKRSRKSFPADGPSGNLTPPHMEAASRTSRKSQQLGLEARSCGYRRRPMGRGSFCSRVVQALGRGYCRSGGNDCRRRDGNCPRRIEMAAFGMPRFYGGAQTAGGFGGDGEGLSVGAVITVTPIRLG